MTEPQTADVVASGGGDKGLSFRGLWEVFYRPAAVFTELKERPRVLVPLVAVALLTLVFAVLVADIIVQLQVNSPQMQERMQGQPMTDGIKSIMKIWIIVGMVVVRMLVPVLAAALALLFGNFVFAGRVQFKQLLSIMAYATVITSVGAILGLPIELPKESIVPPFSLGILAADQGLESPLFALLSRIDLFNIFEFIVTGIGLSVVYNVTRGRGMLYALLSMGLLSIIPVLWAAIF